MEELSHGVITLEAGLEGDFRGAKFKSRQVTVMAIQDWQDAMAELGNLAGPADLAWTVRRANMLVEGMRLPRAKGAVLQIGAVQLEVTGQTNPCQRMEQARAGLLSALHPHWRGGVTCRVLVGGLTKLGDPVAVLSSPREHHIRLPD